MFRNFYDKFSIGYILLFSIIFAFALVILFTRFPRYRNPLVIASLSIIIIFAIPIKQIVNSPLWTTQDIYRTTAIPDEYISFAENAGNIISHSAVAINLPFNLSSYDIIKDQNSNSVYAGRTIFKLFSGVNNLGWSAGISIICIRFD